LNYHLAQINVGRLVAPIDDPQIAEFVAGLEPINALADWAPGFVWRLQSASGNATDIAYNDDPFVIVNMSVWESLAPLREIAYRSDNVRFFAIEPSGSKSRTNPCTACGCRWGIGRRSARAVNGWSTIRCTGRRNFLSGFHNSSRSQRMKAFAHNSAIGWK